MGRMHGYIFAGFLLIVGYIVGAKWPGMAARAGIV